MEKVEMREMEEFIELEEKKAGDIVEVNGKKYRVTPEEKEETCEGCDLIDEPCGRVICWPSGFILKAVDPRHAAVDPNENPNIIKR